MLDLTKSPFHLKVLALLVTLNVALSACSSSRVSPDDISGLPEDVTDSELTQSAPTPEPLIEASTNSTLSSEVPTPQPPRKLKRSGRHHKVAKSSKSKKQIVKKDVVEEVKERIAQDFAKDKETLLASTATVEDVSNTPPPPAELSELPAIVDPVLAAPAQAGQNWVYVAVASLLGAALIGLGLRARRSKTPRRLVLNS